MIDVSDFVTAFRPWTLFTPKDIWDFSRRFFPKDVVPDPGHLKDWLFVSVPWKPASFIDYLEVPKIHGPLVVFSSALKGFLGQNQINLIVLSRGFDLEYGFPYVLKNAEEKDSTEYGNKTIRLQFRALKTTSVISDGWIDVSQPMHNLIEFAMGRSLERAHDNGDWERALDAWDRLQHPAEEPEPPAPFEPMKWMEPKEPDEEEEEEPDEEEEEEPEGSCYDEDCESCKEYGFEWSEKWGKWVLP